MGNVRFRRVFWEAQADKRWWKGSCAVWAGVASAVKTGMKMGGARPDGENVGCGWAAQDEASRADVAGERQRDGQ